MEILLSRLISRLGKLKKDVMKKCKGSFRDPFVHLGAAAVVLFILTPFSTPISSVSLLTTGEGTDEITTEVLFAFPTERVRESPDLSLIQGNSLAAVSPPIMATPQVLGALVGGQDYQWTQNEVTEYEVQPGDSLWLIADKFNISLNTLLWANDLNKNSAIQIGQKLVILPVSGVIYSVKKGDTVSGIAQTYKAKMDEIIAFNDLSGEGDIYAGDILIVPDGTMPLTVQYAPSLVPLANSYFICPIGSLCRMTQGLHWYNAVDFSHGKCGEPIYAAAAGEVLKVKLTNSRSQWAFGGAGNHLTILHPNGVVTYYGHIQTSLVNPGDSVSQGQMIAVMGGQPGTPGAGKSTGCHVHFGVTGARNPFAR